MWSPQYSLWLLPLVALALPRWRPVLLWQCSEAVVWVLLMFQFAGVENKGLSVYPFFCAVIVRDLLIIMLMVMVIREAIRPGTDLVRIAGDDDPSGGLLENQPDRFTLPSLPTLIRKVRPGGSSGSSGPSEPSEHGLTEPEGPPVLVAAESVPDGPPGLSTERP